jgi:hypothetical protein
VFWGSIWVREESRNREWRIESSYSVNCFSSFRWSSTGTVSAPLLRHSSLPTSYCIGIVSAAVHNRAGGSGLRRSFTSILKVEKRRGAAKEAFHRGADGTRETLIPRSCGPPPRALPWVLSRVLLQYRNSFCAAPAALLMASE